MKQQGFEGWLPKTSPQFNWTWPHIVAMTKRLQPITSGKQQHLMFWLPPQHGKSLCVSKHFPAYLIEKNPSKRIILGAYNSRYASTFSRATKRLLINNGFNQFGKLQQAIEWETSQEGFFKSFGMQSGITGTAADLVLIDDPIKGFEDLSEVKLDKVWDTFEHDIETREQPNTSYIVIQTRWHMDDLSGRLLARDGRIEDGGKWNVLCLPALALENDPLGRKIGEPLCPERQSLERLLERQRKSPMMFQALYQQSPTMEGGNIIKTDWFKYHNFPKKYDKYDYRILSVDGAWETKKENDYSVCVTWGIIGNNYYLVDMWRDKVHYPEFKAIIHSINGKYKPLTTIVEDAASGKAFIHEMSSSMTVHPFKPEGDKVARVHAISDIIASGRVFLPAGSPEENPEEYSWLYDFLHEVSSFPKGKHDDIIDVLSQFLRYMATNSSTPISIF
jgi:predicted phage terminase large subunit-like protein